MLALDAETNIAIATLRRSFRAQGYAAHPNPAMPPYAAGTQAYRLYMAGWWAAYYEAEPMYKTCAACGGAHHIVRCPAIAFYDPPGENVPMDEAPDEYPEGKEVMSE